MASTIPEILGYVKMTLDTMGMTPYLGTFLMVMLVLTFVRMLQDR